MNLTLPATDKEKLGFGTVSNDSADWGIHINDQTISGLSNLLSKQPISVKVRFLPVREVSREGFTELVADNLDRNVAVVACYDYKQLMGDGRHIGHVSLVDDVDRRFGRFRLVETESARTLNVSDDALFGSMHCRDGGLLLLHRSGTVPATQSL